MPGKQIPEIPAEQSNIADIADPEEEKDKLNAFYNTCMHRGTRLVEGSHEYGGPGTFNGNKAQFDGKITCIKCKKNIKKTYMQGYCYPCFISSPQTSDCILKPELCQAHEGKSRDMEWFCQCINGSYSMFIQISHTPFPPGSFSSGATNP